MTEGRANAEPVADRAATIYDVAQLAGVSHATVTRVLRNFAGIRPETRERVERAVAALNYRPNMAARSLITGRSNRIGALTHEIDYVGPSRIVQGAAGAARRAGYVLDIVTLDTADRKAVEEGVALVTKPDVAGILVFPSSDEMTRTLERTRFRVPVLISAEQDGVLTGPDTPVEGALDSVVEHLFSLGHTRFFHIAGPENWSASRNRSLAYLRAVSDRGLVSIGTAHGDWSSASGYQVARHIPEAVTAIVSANDQMALGAILALHERGLRVPQDVSVTGIDDVPEAAFYSPPLTTMRVDFMKQGEQALLRLLALMEPSRSSGAPLARPRLIVRASTGPAR